MMVKRIDVIYNVFMLQSNFLLEVKCSKSHFIAQERRTVLIIFTFCDR